MSYSKLIITNVDLRVPPIKPHALQTYFAHILSQ